MYQCYFIVYHPACKTAFKIKEFYAEAKTWEECWDQVEEAYPDAEEITLKSSVEVE